MSEITDRYDRIRERVDEACRRAGRDPREVTLIAVSKTKPNEMVEELAAHGVTDFGENKVQELCRKQEEIKAPLRWHLIGHLQRNKVKQVVGKACLIHSVDSLRLAEEIEKESAKRGLVTPILMEVNIGSEESKSGTTLEEAPALARSISSLPHLHLEGLMCIAPIVEEAELARPYFRALRELSDRIRAEKLPGVEMKHLSMGMTGDFPAAIEEGATFVRVGTAIFGERDYTRPSQT